MTFFYRLHSVHSLNLHYSRSMTASQNVTLLSSRCLLPTASMVCIVNFPKEISQQSTRVGIFFGKVTTLAASVVGQVGMSSEDPHW
jgi:hypothetical protein